MFTFYDDIERYKNLEKLPKLKISEQSVLGVWIALARAISQ